MNDYASRTLPGSMAIAPRDTSQIIRRDARGDRSRTPVLGLGWFSVALGLTELFAPRALGRAVGLTPKHIAILPLFGARELVSGIGILAQGGHTGAWVKARVAGDALDLGLLALAGSTRGADRTRVAAATAAVLGVTALDVLCSMGVVGRTQVEPRSIARSVAIGRPASELYQRLRELPSLPRVLSHVESVELLDERRSRWTSQPVLGQRLVWTAEITEDVPGQRIAWRTLEGAGFPHRGAITLKDLGERRGCAVTVRLEYMPRGGKPGVLLTKLLGEAPEQQILGGLRRWKQLLETGEIATTEGQACGRRTWLSRALP